MELFHWVCPNKVTTMTRFYCKQAVERLNKRSYSISFQQQYSVKEAESLETETAESAFSEGSELRLPFCASATRSCLPVLTYQLGLISQLGVLQPWGGNTRRTNRENTSVPIVEG